MIDAPQPPHKSSGFTEDATPEGSGGAGADGVGWRRRWWKRRRWLCLLCCCWQRSVVLRANRKFRAEQEAECDPISSLPPVRSGFLSSVTLLELKALCACDSRCRAPSRSGFHCLCRFSGLFSNHGCIFPSL